MMTVKKQKKLDSMKIKGNSQKNVDYAKNHAYVVSNAQTAVRGEIYQVSLII